MEEKNRLQPTEIIHKNFHNQIFGYSRPEVKRYLRFIAEEVDILLAEKQRLLVLLRERDAQIAEYREREATFQATLQAAHNMAEKLREDAQREARMIVSDAQHKADILQKEAKESLRNLYEEISLTKQMKLQLDTQMKALLQTHLNLMDNTRSNFPTVRMNEKFLEP